MVLKHGLGDTQLILRLLQGQPSDSPAHCLSLKPAPSHCLPAQHPRDEWYAKAEETLGPDTLTLVRKIRTLQVGRCFSE